MITNEEDKKKLLQYKKHKIYGLMYKAVIDEVTLLDSKPEDESSLSEYVKVFDFIDKKVQYLTKDKFAIELPDIFVKKTIKEIVDKYDEPNNKERIKDDINYLYYPIIVLGIIVAYYESMPEISADVMEDLSYYRSYMENRSYRSNDYKRSNIWHLLAARIPRIDPPKVDDLEVEIQQLKEKLKTVERRLPETIIVELLKEIYHLPWKSFSKVDLAKLGQYVTGYSQESLRTKMSSTSSQIPASDKQKVDELNALLKKLNFDIEIKTKA